LEPFVGMAVEVVGIKLGWAGSGVAVEVEPDMA